jgi:hypothetical protein
VIIALGLLVSRPPEVEAQYMGTFSQQLDTETFSFTWGNTPIVYKIRNLGQAGHSLFIPSTATSGQGCSIVLQGSGDGLEWTTMAALPYTGAGAFNVMLYASGSFTILRIVANPHYSTCTAAGTSKVYYVGYQFSSPAFDANEALTATFKGPTALFPTGTDQNPYSLAGMQCYNPNASTAYIQLFDTAGTAVLGTGYFYQIGVGAGASADFSLHDFSGYFLLYIGAATTAGGSTAVSSSVTCTVEANRRSRFGWFQTD